MSNKQRRWAKGHARRLLDYYAEWSRLHGLPRVLRGMRDVRRSAAYLAMKRGAP